MQFVGCACDVNPQGAAAIATDKTFALWALARHGLPIPDGAAFCSAGWARTIGSDCTPDAALAYAERLGFPVFVKPNALRAGIGVHCVGSATAFADAVRRITRRDRMYRVERPVGASDAPSQISDVKFQKQPARDLRIVVVGDTVVCAYERTPLTVVGDGRATITALLQRHLASLRVNKRSVHVRASDSRIAARLARIRRTVNDVPAAGERVQLLDNANLSSGGSCRDVTDALDPSLAVLAVRAAAIIGLQFAGVDVISEGENHAVILEVNAAPSLAHYATIGPQERARTEECYRRILASFAGMPVTVGTSASSATFVPTFVSLKSAVVQ